MQQKKIVLLSLNPPGHTGVGTSRWNLGQALSRLGHEVYFVTDSTYFERIQTDSDDSIRIIGIKPKICLRSLLWSLAKRLSANLYTDVSAVDIDVVKFASSVGSFLPGFIKEHNIDIVISAESFLEFIYLLPLKQCKTIITFQCPRYLFQQIGLSNEPVNRYLREKEAKIVPAADAWITPSNAMARLASKYYGINLDNINRIPNCLNTDTFYQKQDCSRPSSAKICYVGRFSREKGAELVIDIIPDLMSKYPDLTFSVAGESSILETGGLLIDVLLERLKENSSDSRFSWQSHIEYAKLPEFYNKHNIFISPTLFESFGMSIAEAQACGLPVVVTNAGGAPETLKDSYSGFISPLGDTDAFKNHLERLIANADLRHKMGRNARAFAVENFGFDAVSSQVQNLIERI